MQKSALFAYVVTPGTFEDFVDLVVPELQARGRVWNDYPEGTLRERLSGTDSPFVASHHPAHSYRGAYADKPSAVDGQKPAAAHSETLTLEDVNR